MPAGTRSNSPQRPSRRTIPQPNAKHQFGPYNDPSPLGYWGGSTDQWQYYDQAISSDIPYYKQIVKAALAGKEEIYFKKWDPENLAYMIVDMDNDHYYYQFKKSDKVKRYKWGSQKKYIFLRNPTTATIDTTDRPTIRYDPAKQPTVVALPTGITAMSDQQAKILNAFLPDIENISKVSDLTKIYASDECLTAIAIVNAFKLKQLQQRYFDMNGPKDERTDDISKPIVVDVGSKSMKTDVERELAQAVAKKTKKANEILTQQLEDRAALFQRLLEISAYEAYTPAEKSLAGVAIMQLLFRFDLSTPGLQHASKILPTDLASLEKTLPRAVLGRLLGRYGVGYDAFAGLESGSFANFTLPKGGMPKDGHIIHSLGCTLYVRKYGDPSTEFDEQHGEHPIPYAILTPISSGKHFSDVNYTPKDALALYFTNKRGFFMAMNPTDSKLKFAQQHTESMVVTQLFKNWLYEPTSTGSGHKEMSPQVAINSLYRVVNSDHVCWNTIEATWRFIEKMLDKPYDADDSTTYPDINAVADIFLDNFAARMKLATEAGTTLDKAMKVKSFAPAVTEYFETRGLQFISQASEFKRAAAIADPKLREIGLKRLMESYATAFHGLFMGPPGTGKSYSVKFYAQLVTSLGLLSGSPGKAEPLQNSDFTVLTKSDCVGSALGETAPMTKAALDEHQETVIFFDEVYSFLGSNQKSTGPDSYGQEFADTLTNEMTLNPLGQIIIAAGYQDQLENRFLSANPGLPRRFQFQAVLTPAYKEYIIALAFQVAQARISLRKSKKKILDGHVFGEKVCDLIQLDSGKFREAVLRMFAARSETKLISARRAARKAEYNADTQPIRILFANNRGSISTLVPDLTALGAMTTRKDDPLLVNGLKALRANAEKEFKRRYGSLDYNPDNNNNNPDKTAAQDGPDISTERLKVVDGLANMVRYFESRSPTTTKLVNQTTTTAT